MIATRHDGTEQVLTESLLPWQRAGLQFTPSGYGSKIPTRYVTKNSKGRTVRVYATCISNAASCWFMDAGTKVFIN